MSEQVGHTFRPASYLVAGPGRRLSVCRTRCGVSPDGREESNQ